MTWSNKKFHVYLYAWHQSPGSKANFNRNPPSKNNETFLSPPQKPRCFPFLVPSSSSSSASSRFCFVCVWRKHGGCAPSMFIVDLAPVHNSKRRGELLERTDSALKLPHLLPFWFSVGRRVAVALAFVRGGVFTWGGCSYGLKNVLFV